MSVFLKILLVIAIVLTMAALGWWVFVTIKHAKLLFDKTDNMSDYTYYRDMKSWLLGIFIVLVVISGLLAFAAFRHNLVSNNNSNIDVGPYQQKIQELNATLNSQRNEMLELNSLKAKVTQINQILGCSRNPEQPAVPGFRFEGVQQNRIQGFESGVNRDNTAKKPKLDCNRILRSTNQFQNDSNKVKEALKQQLS